MVMTEPENLTWHGDEEVPGEESADSEPVEDDVYEAVRVRRDAGVLLNGLGHCPAEGQSNLSYDSKAIKFHNEQYSVDTDRFDR